MNGSSGGISGGVGTASEKRKRKQAHLYCRECILANLLTQRKDAKRLESVSAAQRLEEEEAERRADDEARVRAVRDFEAVQAGLETRYRRLGRGNGGGVGDVGRSIVGREGGKVVIEEVEVRRDAEGNRQTGTKKRKFELDEEELVRIAREDREGARRRIDEEKEAKSRSLPSFWLPTTSTTSTAAITTTTTTNGESSKKEKKQTPLCPGSTSSTPHPISLKTLIPIHFSSEKGTNSKTSTSAISATSAQTNNSPTDTPTWTCPACSRALTNASKAVLASTCGHVVCGQCADKFMKGDEDVNPHGEGVEAVVCFVCGVEVGGADGKRKGRDGEKGKKKGGGELLEIVCEGTGFAGGGGNVVTREGVAFQC